MVIDNLIDTDALAARAAKENAMAGFSRKGEAAEWATRVVTHLSREATRLLACGQSLPGVSREELEGLRREVEAFLKLDQAPRAASRVKEMAAMVVAGRERQRELAQASRLQRETARRSRQLERLNNCPKGQSSGGPTVGRGKSGGKGRR